MTENEIEINRLTTQFLADAYIAMEAKIQKAIRCGALDIDGWDPEKNSLVIPKTIVCALLEGEIHNWNGNRTGFEKQIKKDVRNLRKIM